MFKTGKFHNMENGVVNCVIERSNSIQREIIGDIEIKLQISWIDDCTYRLKFLSGNDAFWNSRPKDMPTPDLVVHITKITGNQYTQDSKMDGEDFIYTSTIVKVD